jgi:lipopolysaccharide export system protein LptA
LHLSLWAQVNPDSTKNQPSLDSLKTKKTADTIRVKKDSDFKTTVKYTAKDSIVSDVIREEIYLYGEAEVIYGDINLKAAQIIIDQKNQEVNARGVPDSTGRLKGRPIFKQGQDEYVSDSLKYNFKTEKAVVRGIETKQGENIITGGKSKRGPDGSISVGGGRFTTCNLKHPHWYISGGKIKMIPDKQVVSGPFNLVIADIPTPLGLPFGIFPVVNKRRSGIVVPVYGEAQDRGFYLREGGYYWAVSEYLSALFTGEIYTNGSWGLNTQFTYLNRYRFSGSMSFRYNNRIVGEGDTKQVANDFWVTWSHSPKTRGKGSFSANVNFGTSRFNQRNSFDPTMQLSNNYNSSISYSNSFNVGNSTVTLSLNARHDQNSQTNVMNLTFPELNLGVNRIYPFKFLGNKAPNFLRQINISYRMSSLARFSNAPRQNRSYLFEVLNLPEVIVDSLAIDPFNPLNRINLNNQATLAFSLANFPEIAKNAQIGAVHNIPISTTLKVFKYFSLNPSINYQETWYLKKLDFKQASPTSGVRIDTLSGFTRVYTYSASASLTTRIYGTFLFDKKRKGKYLQAIRHTIVPTIAWSYAPDLSPTRFGFFQTVIDSLGRPQSFSRFQGFEPGASISTNSSGVLVFGLQNFLEAKVKPKGDTAQTKKISILDNVSFAGTYNLVKDTMKLSPISLQARTKLLGVLDLNFNGTLDPYVWKIVEANPDGTLRRQVQIDRYAWQAGQGLGQLSNLNIATGFNFTPKSFQKKSEDKLENALEDKNASSNMRTPNVRQKRSEEEKSQIRTLQNNPDAYVDFDVPWSLNVSYNFSYNKIGFQKAQFTQILSFNGDVSLTKTWKVGFRSGYDISQGKVTFTNFDIIKDLHCWEMRFNINPFGQFQSWSFDLNVKSSLLQDLKLSRRRSFYDRGVIR